MSSAKSYRNERFTTGVLSDVTILPRVWKNGTPVIYCHSAAMNGGEALGLGQLPSIRRITTHISDYGFCGLVAPNLAQLWGSTDALVRIDNALDWLRDSGRANDKDPVLLGSSMGACAALSWAHSRGASAVVGFIPAIDLQAIRISNETLRTSIDAAYDLVYPEPVPDEVNPAKNNPDCPTQFWYSTDDLVSENIDAYSTTIEADLHSVGALGHTNEAIDAVNVSEVASFVEAFV